MRALAWPPPARPRLLVPGLVPRDPARERTACGRGRRRRPLEPDDRLTVSRPRRRPARRARPCSRPSGRTASTALGVATPMRHATVLRALVWSDEDGAAEVVAARHGTRCSTRRARRRSGCSARRRRPGAETTLRAERPRVVIVGAPGRARPRRRRAPRRPTSSSRSPGRAAARRARAALPEPLADPRLDFQVDRASALALRGEGGRVHPGHRRRGHASAPTSSRSTRRKLQDGQGARARRDRDPVADGQRVSPAGPLLEVLRPRPRAARRGRPRHGRPARHVRARLHREVLRGHGLLRATSTARTTSTASSRRTRSSQRKGWPAINFFYNTAFDARQPYCPRRALVAARRLRPAARR